MYVHLGLCSLLRQRTKLRAVRQRRFLARMASRVFAIPQRGLAQLVRANTSQARMDILDQNVAVKRVYANRPAWQVVSQSSLGCAAALAWALLTDRPLLGSRSANIG